MGCWNKTCGISQLPIFVGTETLNFIIVENKPYEGEINNHPSYSNAYWNVIPLPFYGEYNDYGWQDDSEGQEWKYALLKKQYGNNIALTRSGLKDKESQFQRYGDARENPFADGETLGNVIHGNLVGIQQHGNRSGVASLASIIVNRPLFEELTATFSSEERWKKDAISITKEELIAAAEKIIDHCKKVMVTKEIKLDYDDPDLNKLLEELNASSRRLQMGMFITSEHIQELLGISDDDRYYHPAMWFWGWLSAEFGGEYGFLTTSFLRDNRFDIPAKDLVDAFAFIHVMDSLRKQIVPMGHEGSQDGINSIHDKFVVAYQNRIKAYHDWMAEDMEDEEDMEN